MEQPMGKGAAKHRASADEMDGQWLGYALFAKMLALFKAKAHTFLCGCSWQQGGGAFARYPLRQDCYYQTIRSVWRRKELLSFVALFAAVFD